MENIDYLLEKHQKQLELDQTRLGIGNYNNHGPKVDKISDFYGPTPKKDERELLNPFQIYGDIMSRETNTVEQTMCVPEIVTNKPKPPPPTIITDSKNLLHNPNDMDQWVTDAFYSYFPSFNKVEVEKRSKSRDQLRKEYNEYLNRKPIVKHQQQAIEKQVLLSNSQAKGIPIPIPVVDHNLGEKLNLLQSERIIEREIISPRNKHLKDLQHTDLTNILNSDTVAERNKRAIADENRKKMEYQRDLVKQIEDKRVEIERLKQKEKYEEDLLTRRLEDQLKTLELEEELEKEKVFSEKTRLTNEQNHILRMHMLSKLDNDHKIYNPYDVRKTQSENGKDKFADPDEILRNVSRSSEDNKIYKYFSNSARNEKFVLPEINNNNKTNRAQYCKTCQSLLPIEWVTLYGDKLNVCPKCVKVCPFCNHNREEGSSKIDHNNVDNNHLRNKLNRRNHREIEEIRVPEPEDDDIVYQEVQDDDDDYTVDLNPIYVKSRNKKPFSMNLEKGSIFNPTQRVPESKVAVNIKNGEIFVDKIIEKPLKFNNNLEKLKEATDEKLGKYYKNYDDIRKRRSSIGENTKKPKIPNAFQVLEDTPIHKKSNNTRNNDIRVLTKLGAIRKQLQLEQLEMDNHQHK